MFKNIKWFVLGIVSVVLVLWISNTFYYDQYPYVGCVKKDNVHSIVPGVQSYYLYSQNGGKYKVEKEVFDSYTYWGENSYFNKEGREAINKDFNNLYK